MTLAQENGSGDRYGSSAANWPRSGANGRQLAHELTPMWAVAVTVIALVFIGVVYILIMEKVGTDILRNAPERGAAPNHQARTIARIVSATIRRNIRAKSR